MKTYFPEKKIEVDFRLKIPLLQCCECHRTINQTQENFYETKDNQSIYCLNCFEIHLHSLSFRKLKYSPEVLLPQELVGNNPRFAHCDIKAGGCWHSCRGINWKCTRCWDFDLCEHCESLGKLVPNHNPEHGLLKLYYTKFSPLKWEWSHQNHDKENSFLLDVFFKKKLKTIQN